MPVFELWLEGFIATGDSGTAVYLGTSAGKDFEDAVRNYYAKKAKDYFYNPVTLTYYGCKHFSNEADARKSYG